ncbi:L,D-transpeptidase family protein [Flavisolibacter nicotianae]|uniref:L,D-transpeptidase family protein n=1 Tax=Flavisolibacter nicotianae TaxID=2364882 RepID=UPI000EAF55D3|nr:L,D-transpeptidase [Flavisolibacter nicotianae]
MKTALLLTTCILASGGLMLTKSANDALNWRSNATVTKAKTLSATRRMSTNPIAPMYIVVDKKKYELSVYDAKGWFATYPVVFGNNSLDDKRMEGDRKTPEGQFKINQKRPHEKWDRYMGIDYPNQESIAKFNMRKQRGEIPSWAKPGGGIGIHGTWPDDDYVVDHFRNWTNGCISLKRHDVEDLYSYIPVGTPVYIRK